MWTKKVEELNKLPTTEAWERLIEHDQKVIGYVIYLGNFLKAKSLNLCILSGQLPAL